MSARRRASPPAGARIAGAGMAVPSRVMTNADLEQIVDTSDEWIVQRTGIRQRHVSGPEVGTSDLAVEATRQALQRASLEAAELDLLICATMTPDMICPATACQVVAKLGAVPCGAMDMNLACTGFVGGLNIAANFVATGWYRNIAVIGAEQLSRIVNWEDRRTCVLFGDGAGAAIVTASTDPRQGCLHQSMHSDGSRWHDLYCPRCVDHLPAEAAFSGRYDTLQMNGREVYRFAVHTLQETVREALEACEMTVDDVRWIVPHQSNVRIIGSAREKLGVPTEKMYVNLDRYGNTSAASVGICLAELWERGEVGRGDVVVFIGLGGGLTWAVSVWRL